MTLDDTLAVLHPVQRAAVTHPARPLLLACGPGSGKTRILTHRIQWLIQREGLEATEILALTFSRPLRTSCAADSRGRWARWPSVSGPAPSTGSAPGSSAGTRPRWGEPPPSRSLTATTPAASLPA